MKIDIKDLPIELTHDIEFKAKYGYATYDDVNSLNRLRDKAIKSIEEYKEVKLRMKEHKLYTEKYKILLDKIKNPS